MEDRADEPRLLHCIDSVIVLVSCKYVCSSGHSYLTTDPRLLEECESIKTHVRKGCLSDLPVGAGTNRNERLHRYLRPHFSHTRLGLLMALSMMTITLHHYNCQLLEKRGEVQMPIQSLPDVGTDFQFGIVDKHNYYATKNGKYMRQTLLQS